MIASRPTSPTGTSKIGERKVAEQLLAQVPLHPTVTTFDALHTSVKQAEQIRTGGGHSLFIVKRNPRTLYQDIRWEHSNTWCSRVTDTGRLSMGPLQSEGWLYLPNGFLHYQRHLQTTSR
jgi:hypothetical protein